MGRKLYREERTYESQTVLKKKKRKDMYCEQFD